jgi:CRISPR-associated protein Csy3
MAKNKKNVTASVLAFEKKLVPSDGYMYGTVWENRTEASSPLQLVEKSVRGTISNRLKSAVANDPMKLNAEVEKPNLQRVDSCALSEDQDTLKLHFTLKVLGGIHEPSACNSPEFLHRYQKVVANYIETEHFEELGKRYATNLANARFLWRNRVGAEKIEVHITDLTSEEKTTWIFDAKKYPLRDFDIEDKQTLELGKRIAETLSSQEDFVILDIVCYAKVGKAQEVYPSEELILDKGQGKKSKVLYNVDGIAAMHSQKLGNALRTIDTWYPDFVEEQRPIAIEPYGAVTNLGRAFRNPKNKEDFFTLFDRLIAGADTNDSLIGDDGLEKSQRDYVMAVLVRGGVFGESDNQ